MAYGSYSLTARATDNQGAQTVSIPVTVISNAPPSVDLTSPAANTTQTAPASFTLTANATDVDGTIQMVEFYNGATLLGTATAAPYTLSWNNVPYGSYSLTAVATDDRGAQTVSIPVTVISNAPPSVDLTSPAANTTQTAPASFTLTADATDSDGAIEKVEFYNGATLLGTATAAPYSVIWSNVPVGTYSLTARATDNQGAQTSSAPVDVTVKTGIAQAYYIHTDHLDTPRMITDTAGHVVWQWDNSDPFGGNAPDENPAGQGTFNFNLRFAGQYFDRETNTHYNVNRDYDPATGRYIQSDPIGLAGGINTYTYVGGNPLSFIDPKGLAGVLPGPVPLPLPGPIIPGQGKPRDDGSFGGLFPPGSVSSGSGASSSSQSSSCPEPDCQALYDAIDGVVFNLQQRYHALIADKYKLPPTGPMSVAGHQQQFLNRQAQLRKLLNQANAQGCTGYRSDAWEWATIPVPSPGG